MVFKLCNRCQFLFLKRCSRYFSNLNSYSIKPVTVRSSHQWKICTETRESGDLSFIVTMKYKWSKACIVIFHRKHKSCLLHNHDFVIIYIHFTVILRTFCHYSMIFIDPLWDVYRYYISDKHIKRIKVKDPIWIKTVSDKKFKLDIVNFTKSAAIFSVIVNIMHRNSW